MKLLFLGVALALVSSACGNFKTSAQISSSSNGKVANIKSNQTKPKIKTFEISTVDFRNFTYPYFTGDATEKTFTLKNGTTGKIAGTPQYTLRKTYYFDLTGDRQDEAITHIIADGCQMGCESSSLFYIHRAENNQPVLFWKLGIGGDTMGGLKSVNFNIDEIILEVFGECTANNGLVKAAIDLTQNPNLRISNYTRFVFKREANGYTQTERDVFPLSDTNLEDYRPQISFGKPRQ